MKQPIVPKPLKPGDTIGIVAPAAAFNDEKFQTGVSAIKDMGFTVDIPDGIYKRKRYLAGDDQHRAQAFESMVQRSDIDGIVCARGGFGTLRMIPYVSEDVFMLPPKRLIGFSDITVLLNVLAFHYGWVTFHGPVVTMLANADPRTIDAFYRALTDPFPENMPPPDAVKILSKGNKQTVSGRLWGGNLTTLCHMVGTPYAINCLESILFLEDRGEAPYRIDRLLVHMHLAGTFDHVKGVLLGSFLDCGDMDHIYELILECFGDEIPVFAGYDCGHALPNYVFPVGIWAEMNTDVGSVTFSK
ncbi:MAG: LD-carboxypeptidase [Candidatus Magnetomorum sp.]|nr:LD-carboxypeptidase [Candidatus Magnetomorum sp.]